MPRVLAVTPWAPSPRRPRSLGLLSMLAECCEVVLVAAYWSADEKRDLDSLPFRVIGVKMSRTSAIIRAAWYLTKARPMQQGYLDASAMRRAIAEAESEFRPDLVYFNTLRSAQWRRAVNTKRRIIDLDEFRSAYYAQVARSGSSKAWRLVARIEAFLMRSEEQRIIEHFGRTLVSSPVDIHGDQPKIKLVRSPHALGALNGLDRTVERTDVTFVGRMSYSANVDAVVWFVNKVWPSVLRKHPTAIFNIVGDAPTKAVRALASPTVRVWGRVDSVREFYQSAAVTVVPVTMATGVQMKLIEALRMGAPTVTTRLVAEQAGVNDGHEVLVAQSPEDWAVAVCRLLEDRSLSRNLSQRGHDWASEAYSLSSIRTELLNSLDLPEIGDS